MIALNITPKDDIYVKTNAKNGDKLLWYAQNVFKIMCPLGATK